VAYRLNIHSAYIGVRRINDQIVIHGVQTDLIFSPCIDGSGGLWISHSFMVCRCLVAYLLNIHSV
jgi:hypothetical protein